ncbi:MAG: FtsX-like permease family protein, partial [Gemmatimonadota bacterium]
YALPVFAYRQDGSRTEFFRDMSVRLRDLPGVLSVGAVDPIPFSGDGSPVGSFALDAGDEEAWLRNRAAYHEIVPGVFETLGIQVLAGRAFELLDNEPGAEPVVVIDQFMAERHFPSSDPVGKTIYVASAGLVPEDATATPARIIGVVEHAKFDGVLDEGRETIYRPHLATGAYLMNFVVKTAGPPELLIPDVRRITREIDATLPVLSLRSLDEVVSLSMAPTRFAMVLLALFAGVALTLAAIGLYGVIAYVVRQRRFEIGLRIALGADQSRILNMILWGGLRLAGAGLAAGLVAAIILSGTLRTLLYGVGQADPITYVAISALLLAVSALASLVPAIRAASVPPAITLRAE